MKRILPVLAAAALLLPLAALAQEKPSPPKADEPVEEPPRRAVRRRGDRPGQDAATGAIEAASRPSSRRSTRRRIAPTRPLPKARTQPARLWTRPTKQHAFSTRLAQAAREVLRQGEVRRLPRCSIRRRKRPRTSVQRTWARRIRVLEATPAQREAGEAASSRFTLASGSEPPETKRSGQGDLPGPFAFYGAGPCSAEEQVLPARQEPYYPSAPAQR